MFCGIKVESIMDRKQDDISIDLLARVLVDVQLDSSKILEDLLSGYQRGASPTPSFEDSGKSKPLGLQVGA